MLAALPLVDSVLAWHATLQADPTARWLEEHNVIEQLPQVAGVQRITTLLNDEAALTAISQSPELRRLVKLPEIQALARPLADDEQLRDAVERDDLAAVINHPEVRRLMDDPQAHALIEAYLPDLRQALRRTGNDRLIAEADQLTTADVEQLREAALRIAEAARVAR